MWTKEEANLKASLLELSMMFSARIMQVDIYYIKVPSECRQLYFLSSELRHCPKEEEPGPYWS